MQVIKTLLRLIIFISPIAATAQTTYLPQDSKEYHFMYRLEIKQQRSTNLNFSGIKPYSRKAVVQEAEYIDSNRKWKGGKLSKADQYNLESLYMDNSEWVSSSKPYFMSKKPVLKTFYKDKANAIEVNNKDFFLAVNPMLSVQLGKESNNDNHVYVDTRGITVRGMIARKVGFSSSI